LRFIQRGDRAEKINQSFTTSFYLGMSAAAASPTRFHGVRFVSIPRGLSASLGLILAFLATLALAAPTAQASTATSHTHHGKSSKTHHATSSGHKGKTHHTAQNHTGHKKSTATG
jgi:hypothetical protein